MRARYLQNYENGLMAGDAWIILDESCAYGLDHTLNKLVDDEPIKEYIKENKLFKCMMSTDCTR